MASIVTSRVSLLEVSTMERDSDRLYKAVTIPWMSPYGLAVEVSGMGFANLFEDMSSLKTLDRRTIHRDDWEFVGLWRPRFEGWRPITLLVFRTRAETPWRSAFDGGR